METFAVVLHAVPKVGTAVIQVAVIPERLVVAIAAAHLETLAMK